MMAKQGIHPKWYDAAPVVCNGTEVMTVGGTKASYNVDIYSGNHPFYMARGPAGEGRSRRTCCRSLDAPRRGRGCFFFSVCAAAAAVSSRPPPGTNPKPRAQGVNTAMVIDEGQLNKFKRRFADLEELSTVATANSPSGEWSMAKPEPKTASSGKGKGKKK